MTFIGTYFSGNFVADGYLFVFIFMDIVYVSNHLKPLRYAGLQVISETNLRLRQRGFVPREQTNTPMLPVADIFGIKIALKEEKSGLLIPIAGPRLSAKFSKFGIFHSKAITLVGRNVGGT